MLAYPIGSSGQIIRLADSVLDVFSAHRQRKCWQREAGGMLFARIEGKDILVVEATSPSRQDRRTRFSFAISKQKAQSEINSQHNIGLHYVGEWHTHPEQFPTPSQRDELTMSSRVKKSDHQLNGFVFAIVGQGNFPSAITMVVHDGSCWHKLDCSSSDCLGVNAKSGSP
jgi:integrative and conjugative element protein (TIGR02256 family)